MATDDESPESLSPEEAFALLGNESRLAILRALWEQWGESTGSEPVPFSDLRERSGIRDSGQFNYHLNKLTGRFVRKSEEGYQLRFAGFQIMGAILSGVYTRSGSMEPVPIDDPCPACGEPLEARYEDERGEIGCSVCDERLSAFSIPPGALEGYDREELPFLFEHWIRALVQQAAEGVCPSCHGRMTVRVTRDEVPGEVSVLHECHRCPERVQSSLGSALLFHPAVVAFLYDHGVDVQAEPSWRLDWLHEDTVEVTSTEPFRARFTVQVEGDELDLTVDDELNVLTRESR